MKLNLRKLNKPIQSILFGVAIGDALGVPVEFKSREYLKKYPVFDMQEYGTHHQPKGTWSDDTSLTLCLAESIAEGFDLNKLANKFIAWKNDNYWTAHNWVFDIGAGTRVAIERLEEGVLPESAGPSREQDNGNGSLMRILPLILLTKDLSIEQRYALTSKVSSITHGHIRSVVSCFYYLEFAKYLLEGKNINEAYLISKSEVLRFLKNKELPPSEIGLFNRILFSDLSLVPEDEIQSSGYVIHSLEASIWCLLITDSYEQAVLKAINLGKDTDTTGAITGGLAALYYGFDTLPKSWISIIVKKEAIFELCNRFDNLDI